MKKMNDKTSVKVDIDIILSAEQAINRYNLLKKELQNKEDHALSEFVKESAELVESLQTGEPIEQDELKYFLEDLTTFWEAMLI
jgi:hypothetical protein